jgi:hypothetical protein
VGEVMGSLETAIAIAERYGSSISRVNHRHHWIHPLAHNSTS